MSADEVGPHRTAWFAVHPNDPPKSLRLHLAHSAGPGTTAYTLVDVVDGVPVWRALTHLETPGGSDGILLDRRWRDALTTALLDGDRQGDDEPTPVSAEALEELRDELERWRETMTAIVDVDRARIDQLLDRLVCGR